MLNLTPITGKDAPVLQPFFQWLHFVRVHAIPGDLFEGVECDVLFGAHAFGEVTVGRYLDYARDHSKPFVVYNTEPAAKWSETYTDLMNQAAMVWHYSSLYAKPHEPWLPLYRFQKPWTLGGRAVETERDIPLLFYGSRNERRNQLLYELGDDVAVIPFGTYGDDLSRWLFRAQWVLSPQYYAGGPVCQPRILEALAHGCNVVSEAGPDQDDTPGVVYLPLEQFSPAAELKTRLGWSPASELRRSTHHLYQRNLDLAADAMHMLRAAL